GDWRPEPGKVHELATLPNDLPATSFQRAAQDLVEGATMQVILENDKLTKYRKGIDRHKKIIKGIVSPGSEKKAYHLADAIDAMLQDKGKEKDATEFPNLTEFWASGEPKVSTLRKDAQDLRDQARYGDAFVVAGTFGKGKVTAVMTSAGKEWNEWGGGSDASVIYQPFIWESQNWLSSQGS